MNILVTGGCGYVGGFCARALARTGHKVVAYDNLSCGSKNAFSPLIEGDILDEQKLNESLKGMDAVMHLAALASVPESIADPIRYWNTNLCGTVKLLKAMDNNNVKRIIFSSTAAVYGNNDGIIDESTQTRPVTPYGHSKLAAERLIEAWTNLGGRSATIFRYFNVCGAESDGTHGECRAHETHVIPCVLRAALGISEKFTLYGTTFRTLDGTAMRDYVDVRDVASAHLLALGKDAPLNTFVVGNGISHSVKSVIEYCAKTAGAFKYEIANARPGDPALLVSNPARIKRTLNWQPQYRLEESIKDTAVWIKRSYSA